MSDQDNIEDEAININEEEQLSPALQIALHLSSKIIQASINMIDEHISHYYLHMPYLLRWMSVQQVPDQTVSHSGVW